jgi:hypothetical protein
MRPYKTKVSMITGSDYGEIVKSARLHHKKIAAKTKRQPYVRSKYFGNKKVFVDSFWDHLGQKSRPDRIRRLKLFPCAIELIRDSTCVPTIKPNPNDYRFTVYRFEGETPYGLRFMVQINEDKKTKKRYFMSVFPV